MKVTETQYLYVLDRVVPLRESGMSFKSISERIKCSPSTLRRWMNGESFPDPGKHFRLQKLWESRCQQ